ncbi:MAG: RNA polymerase sigma factor [Prolixibacteraceae bacterium]|nr:RNA polymerase sigma factor [Prolixibacteraceae bacterium]
MQDSDKELVEHLKSERKEEAFRELICQYQKRLYWHIRKIVLTHEDADDVLQETFLKVWRNIDNFREESSLFTWLYRIAANESLTFISKQKKRAAASLDDVSNYLNANLESDEYFEGDEIQIKLQKAILTLPDKQKIVFNMRYFEEMPYQEMSEILNTSVGALKASYHHAAKKIEDYFNDLE